MSATEMIKVLLLGRAVLDVMHFCGEFFHIKFVECNTALPGALC